MEIILILINTLVLAQSLFTLLTMTYAWHSKDIIEEFKSPDEFSPPSKTFSLLIPARNEEAVIADTILSLSRINYPRNLFEIIIILVPEDIATNKIAQSTINSNNISNARILLTNTLPKSKSRSLNEALKVAKGEIICIFDAEDEVSPSILNLANTVYANKQCEVLQCGVQLMNYNAKWFSALSILEYFFWFKSSLLYFSKQNIMPLGGNTIFITRSRLQEVNGWDESCLTEDADLGIRLSIAKAKMTVIYDAQSSTKEETPENISDYIKQRTRWIQGFFQIFRKMEWTKLPTLKQKYYALYFLLWPAFQLLIVLYLIVSLVVFPFLKISLLVSLYSSIPMFLLSTQMIILILGMWTFTREYKLKFPWYMPFKIILSFIPYQFVLTVAAFRALYRELKGVTNWEKTAHANIHRQTTNQKNTNNTVYVQQIKQ
jgi:glycosyltransferase XagB